MESKSEIKLPDIAKAIDETRGASLEMARALGSLIGRMNRLENIARGFVVQEVRKQDQKQERHAAKRRRKRASR